MGGNGFDVVTMPVVTVESASVTAGSRETAWFVKVSQCMYVRMMDSVSKTYAVQFSYDEKINIHLQHLLNIRSHLVSCFQNSAPVLLQVTIGTTCMMATFWDLLELVNIPCLDTSTRSQIVSTTRRSSTRGRTRLKKAQR